jgi:hypothetical protein
MAGFLIRNQSANYHQLCTGIKEVDTQEFEYLNTYFEYDFSTNCPVLMHITTVVQVPYPDKGDFFIEIQL